MYEEDAQMTSPASLFMLAGHDRGDAEIHIT